MEERENKKLPGGARHAPLFRRASSKGMVGRWWREKLPLAVPTQGRYLPRYLRYLWRHMPSISRTNNIENRYLGTSRRPVPNWHGQKGCKTCRRYMYQ